MTINHSKMGRSTSLALSALLLAASVTPQLRAVAEDSTADSAADTPSGRWSGFSLPDRIWLSRALYSIALATIGKVAYQKSKTANDPSLICSPNAGIMKKCYHFYNQHFAGQAGSPARVILERDGKTKYIPATPTYGLAGTFWANHKDITAFLTLNVILASMVNGFDLHAESVTGMPEILNKLLSYFTMAPSKATS